MPNHRPPIWERCQGHSGRPERPEAYARFRGWLELGPSRSLSAYAAALGITRQALAQTAARYRWHERARAWDTAEAAAGRSAPPPPPPPPQRPTATITAPSSPSPAC